MAGKNQFVLNSFVKKIQKELDDNARANMRKACQFAAQEIRSVLNTKHVSSPGSPPGRLSGRLRKKIKYQIEKINGSFVGVVGSTDFKANWMEFSTTKMQARPFINPTLERITPEIQDILAERMV